MAVSSTGCWALGYLRPVLEGDTSDDLRQLIFALQPGHVFEATMTSLEGNALCVRRQHS